MSSSPTRRSPGKVQDESILADLNYKLNTRATELLFLKWFIDHLAPGGRAGVIVPNGVLFGSTNAATRLRELLLTECDLQAVISLPSGVFKPYCRRRHRRPHLPKIFSPSPRSAERHLRFYVKRKTHNFLTIFFTTQPQPAGLQLSCQPNEEAALQ